MMHEDDFPFVMKSYRVLRKEGIKFPKREVNHKNMIQFDGITSPVFAAMEGQSSNSKVFNLQSQY